MEAVQAENGAVLVFTVEQLVERIKTADARAKAALEESAVFKADANKLRGDLDAKLAAIRGEVGAVPLPQKRSSGKGNGGPTYAERLAMLPDRFSTADVKALYGPTMPTAHYPLIQWATQKKAIRSVASGVYAKAV